MREKGRESELRPKFNEFDQIIMDNIPFYLILHILTIKLSFLVHIDDIEETNKVFYRWNEKFDNFKPVTNNEKSIKAYYCNVSGVILNTNFEFLKSYNCFLMSLDLRNQLINEEFDVLWQKFSKGATLLNITNYYLMIGEVFKALENAKKLYNITQTTSTSKLRLAYASSILGGVLFLIGKPYDALRSYEESFNLLQEIKAFDMGEVSLTGLINIYLKTGNYSKAFKDIEKLESLYNNSTKKTENKIVNSLKTQYYKAIGEPEKALELVLNYLDILPNYITKRKEFIIWDLLDVVDLTIDLNKFDSAYKYLDEILDALKVKIKSPISEFEFNFKLINTLVKLGELQKANIIYEKSNELIDFLEKQGNVYFTNLHKYSHAILIKNKRRLKDKLGAIDEFEHLINIDNPACFEITVKSIINVIELLLIEYQSDQIDEIINEITKYIKKFNSLVEHHQNKRFKIESLILGSKISIIEGNIDHSLDYLDQALVISNENNLIFYSEKIKKEHEKIESEIKNDQFYETELQQRIKFSEITNYIKEILDSNLLKK